VTKLTTIPVPERAETTPDCLLASIARRKPIKVRGLTARWAASAWTFESLRNVANDVAVKVLVDLPAAGGALPGGQDSYERPMRFADFLDLSQAPNRSRPCYLGYARPEGIIPGYQSAFDFEPLTPPSPHSRDTRLWIGSAGTCSGLHSDLKDNLFAQMHGRKIVYLVPFTHSRLVYPFVDNIVNSRIDPEQWDERRFPLFRYADVYQTTVDAGDLLFIPRGWWHYLRSESPSISINHWFGEAIPQWQFLTLLLKLGPPYLSRTLADLVRYSLFGKTYKKDFFFTPPSTGERLYNLVRWGNFSRSNDPSLEAPSVELENEARRGPSQLR
jgi:lysine-specific demethylase 8